MSIKPKAQRQDPKRSAAAKSTTLARREIRAAKYGQSR